MLNLFLRGLLPAPKEERNENRRRASGSFAIKKDAIKRGVI
jgi:hypothetical protein